MRKTRKDGDVIAPVFVPEQRRLNEVFGSPELSR